MNITPYLFRNGEQVNIDQHFIHGPATIVGPSTHNDGSYIIFFNSDPQKQYEVPDFKINSFETKFTNKLYPESAEKQAEHEQYIAERRAVRVAAQAAKEAEEARKREREHSIQAVHALAAQSAQFEAAQARERERERSIQAVHALAAQSASPELELAESRKRAKSLTPENPPAAAAAAVAVAEPKQKKPRKRRTELELLKDGGYQYNHSKYFNYCF
jgi:hypothetical protein